MLDWYEGRWISMNVAKSVRRMQKVVADAP